MELRIISADNHVQERSDLLEGLPEHLQELRPRRRTQHNDTYIVGPGRRSMRARYGERYTRWANDAERRREFRADPTGGRDPDHRLSEQALDGVFAEVLYPNSFLSVSGHPNAEYQATATRLYNDALFECFGDRPDRFVPVAVLPALEIDDAVAELERVAALGYRSALMPVSVPWLPYNEPDYGPLWSTFEDTGVVCAFHVFTGNLGFMTEFADPLTIPLDRLERYRARVDGRGWEEVLNTTVGGCIAAVSPLLHLTGSGALERHPRLRFVLAECEAGWLAWALSMMDRMVERRHYALRQLPMRPSEYFRRQGYITFSDDEVAMELVDRVGAERMMWSNDYPHDEGTFPHSAETIARTMGGLDDTTRCQLLSGTAAELYGFDKLWAAAAT